MGRCAANQLPVEVRRAWGYRLRAIQGGRASQRAFRMRGIDPWAAGRAAMKRKRERAKLERMTRTS